MAHTARRPTPQAKSEAARFLDRTSDYLRDARIKGIRDMDTLRAFVAYENQRENPRQDVLDLLADQAEEIRNRSTDTDS